MIIGTFYFGSREERVRAEMPDSAAYWGVTLVSGLKYLSCRAITAMKTAGGTSDTTRDRTGLVSNLNRPMLENLCTQQQMYNDRELHSQRLGNNCQESSCSLWKSVLCSSTSILG